MSQEVKQQRPKRDIILGILSVTITLALIGMAIYYRNELVRISNIGAYSLLGLFIVTLIAASLISVTGIPIPYALLVFTLPGVLALKWGLWAPVWVGLVAAGGASLGEFPTFIVGYMGGGLSHRIGDKINKKLFERAMSWARRRGSLTVFAMSAIINPIHLPITLSFGIVKFSPWKFFVFTLLGNIVKGLTIAFAGYFGLTTLLHLN